MALGKQEVLTSHSYVTARTTAYCPIRSSTFPLHKRNMPIDQVRRKRMLGHIDRWKSSGITQLDYCTKEGIDYS
jgi:hypothetical protein